MTKKEREKVAQQIYGFFTEIGIIEQLSTTNFERALPRGMTMAQFGVLNRFARIGGSDTPARLAAAFQVTKGAMTNTVHKLESKGLVSVKPDPDDGRRKLVRLTARGRRQRDQALTLFTPALFEVVDDQTRADIVAVLPHLGRIRERLDTIRNERDFGTAP